MVICRFFQQGYCRYGNSCRFEHQGNARQIFPNNQYNTNYNSNSNQNQSNYNVATSNRFGAFNNDNRGGKQFAQSSGGGGGGTTFNDFVNSVIHELESGIKGNQWPFSCFAPQKDGDNWPGLNDMSPEELRFEAYQCQQQGRINTYVNEIDQLKMAHAAKNNEIKSRSPAVMDLLKRCFQGQKIESKPFSAPFGQQSSDNNVASAGTFSFSLPQFGGGSSQQSTGFPLFGQNNPVVPPPPPSYGQSTSSWPNTSQPFAPPNPLIQPSNMFGPSTNTNPFQTPPFGQPPAQQQQMQSVFGTPPLQPFGGVNNAPFQAQNTQPAAIMSVPQTQTIVTVSSFSSNDPTLNAIHTRMDELTPDEKEQFMAAAFTAGKIPIRPPPKELC